MKGRCLDQVLGQLQKLFTELVSTCLTWWHVPAFILLRDAGSEFGIAGMGRVANTEAGKIKLSINSLGPGKDAW